MFKFALFVLLFFQFKAFAIPPDPLIGVRFSLATLQKLLSAPPLPALDYTSKGRLSIQGSYITTKDSSGDLENYTYSSSFTGESLGLGYTSPMRSNNMSWFAFAIGTAQSGSATVDFSMDGSAVDSLNNIKSTGGAVVAGINSRFWGDENSFISLGGFIGPAYLSFNSSYTEVSTGQPNIDVTSSPTLYGPFFGLQARVHLDSLVSKLALAPYIVSFIDVSPSQKQALATMNGAPIGVANILMSGTFVGLGLNVIYKYFRINIISSVSDNPATAGADITNYQLGYSWDL